MLVSHLRHFYSEDTPDVSVDEGVESEEMMLLNRPVFTSPEEDVDNVLDEDLVFEFELDELVLEEVA